ncbi:hypothetical protein FE257_006590 [Aspergillus nanangensis]|uniref:Phospholipid/glycerol acyltransferase domain-containing protein n=1 Tax=Aspergillus nanangensis TaxID=2582783 RepID=A0AAD4GZF4_ASPNN|nr:hypothetical protein FE257_006590 [Aspergillus nanangensis]
MPSQKSPVDQSAPDLEIVGDKLTLHPSGFTGGPEPQDDQIMERNLVQHMSRFRQNPFEFLREVTLHMSGSGWRAYDGPLGQPIFYNGFTERMKANVVASPLLQNKVEELAERSLNSEEAQGLLALQKGTTIEEKRAKRRYEMLICYRLGIALPVVVAGDNLNMMLVGWFLQHAGAMWIRRSFGNDPLYATVVQAYVDTLLQRGYNFECFIEGGRSRTGKLLAPKFGILKFIVDSILSGRVEDTIICPVSTQYDKVLETESYISELLGQPKQKENLADFLSSFNVLSLKLGRVDVRFHEPWSLKEYIGQQLTRMAVPISTDGPQEMSTDERERLFRALGYRVLGDINNVSVVMPTALVGTVLLTLRGRGVGKTELVRRVDWLSERVHAKGGRVAHFYRNPTEVVVDRALDVLGDKLVGRIDSLAEPTYVARDRFQLSFYRNMTIHLFISEAIVSAAMYTKIKQGGAPTNQRINYTDLLEQVAFLSRLFRNEFIFPTEGLPTNLQNTIHGLENDDVITVTRNSNGIPEFVELSAAERLGKTLYHQGDLSYYEAVNKEALKNAYEQFAEDGIIIIKNDKESLSPPSLRLTPEWTPQRDPSTGKILPMGRLWDYAGKIAQSRREGKNRRDGATVASRVLAMSEKVGRTLLESSAAAARQRMAAPSNPRL